MWGIQILPEVKMFFACKLPCRSFILVAEWTSAAKLGPPTSSGLLCLAADDNDICGPSCASFSSGSVLVNITFILFVRVKFRQVNTRISSVLGEGAREHVRRTGVVWLEPLYLLFSVNVVWAEETGALCLRRMALHSSPTWAWKAMFGLNGFPLLIYFSSFQALRLSLKIYCNSASYMADFFFSPPRLL